MLAEPDSRQGKEDKPEPEANFALSGKLAAESNTVKGVVLVHQEPPEARKPSQMWRLYGFKNGMAGDGKLWNGLVATPLGYFVGWDDMRPPCLPLMLTLTKCLILC